MQQPSGTPWGKIIGFTCAGCAVVSLLVAIIIFAVGYVTTTQLRSKEPAPTSPGTAATDFYGEWRGAGKDYIILREGSNCELEIGSFTLKGASAQFHPDESLIYVKGLMGIGKRITVSEMPQGGAGGQLTVDGISFSRADSGFSGATEEPSSAEAATLAKESLLEFHEGVQAGDLSDFHDGLSQSWKNEFSLEKTTEIFQVFLERKPDLSWIENLEPTFTTEPSVGSNGYLTADGYFTNGTQRLEFELAFEREAGSWLINKFKVSLQ